MAFSIENHLLSGATFQRSPHCSALTSPLSLIVIHSMSLPAGQFGTDYVRQLFLGELDTTADESFAELQGLKVSAHLFIRRTGEVLQFVPFDKAAWHAGVSRYKWRRNCNNFSLGLELEGSPVPARQAAQYEEVQYEVLQEITRLLLTTYQIPHRNILGHKDIARPRGRKSDPWHFDWERFRAHL